MMTSLLGGIIDFWLEEALMTIMVKKELTQNKMEESMRCKW